MALSTFVPPVRAGLLAFVVTRDVALGNPVTAHQGLSSAATAVAVQPTVTLVVARTGTRSLDGVPVATGTITTTFDPRVGAEQQVTLLLLEIGAPATRARRAASLAARDANNVTPPALDTASVVFSFTDLPTGNYAARARVDGVDSPVSPGADGPLSEPKVIL